jgi:hypothetical protein
MFTLTVPLVFGLTSLHLYLDPGSGSILLQLLIAGLAGAGLFIGISWKKIKNFFRGRKGRPAPEEEEEEDDD